jgi:cytochrome P450
MTVALGPRALPLVGGALQLRGDPLRRIGELRDRYGGVVPLGPAPGTFLYLVTAPSAVKHVLVDNYKAYKKGRAAQRMAGVLGRGSLLLEGDAWRQRRRLVMPSFHRSKIAAIASSFTSAAEALAESWKSKSEPIDLREEMLRLTMALTIKNLFRADDASEELQRLVAAWGALYDEMTRSRLALVRPPSWLKTARKVRFEESKRTVDEILGRFIERRRAAADDDGSLLTMLVNARDAENDAQLSDPELRDEVMTLFVGGYETSSNALSFTLALLAAHGDIARRHREELDSVLEGRVPGMDDLAKLPFNRMVLEESMRLFPPSWMITREALEDDVLEGVPIPRGSQLLISIYGTHHDPKVWPDPEKFDPDRFASADRAKLSYFPFGGGQRLCMGDQYALTEMQLVIAILMQRLTLRLAPGTSIGVRADIGLRPASPLRVLATAR